VCYNLINKIIKVEPNIYLNNYNYKQFIIQCHNGTVRYIYYFMALYAIILLYIQPEDGFQEQKQVAVNI